MSRESVVRKYQVGHRKKHPISRNFIIVGEKVSQEEKTVEQVLQYNESSSEYKEDTSNEKELLGCQGKGEPERKIPDKHGLQDEIHSSDSEVRMMITENPDSVPRKDDLPEEIVNERQIIDTSDVASTNVKSGLMNVGTDDMSDAADEYEVEGADASHGIFTLTAVEDAVIHMHLIQIALLVHSDRTTVLAQPNVNHRALSINDIKNGDFITKMQEKNNDYAEEMHALVYEIRTVTSSAEDNVAVFSTYNTTIDTPEGHQIINVEAIYPTLEGLKKLSKAMGFSNPPLTNVFKTVFKNKNLRFGDILA